MYLCHTNGVLVSVYLPFALVCADHARYLFTCNIYLFLFLFLFLLNQYRHSCILSHVLFDAFFMLFIFALILWILTNEIPIEECTKILNSIHDIKKIIIYLKNSLNFSNWNPNHFELYSSRPHGTNPQHIQYFNNIPIDV